MSIVKRKEQQMKDKLLPMNLQFFAEEGEPETKETEETKEPDKEPEKKEDVPNAQELLVEISRLKRQVDKASS